MRAALRKAMFPSVSDLLTKLFHRDGIANVISRLYLLSVFPVRFLGTCTTFVHELEKRVKY